MGPDVPRSPGSSVPPPAVDSPRERRPVMTSSRPLSRTPPRRPVPSSPRGPAPGPEPTPDPSRSPSSRSGATCPLRSLASPKKLLLQLKIPSQDNNMSLSLPFESIFIIDLLYHSERRLNQQNNFLNQNFWLSSVHDCQYSILKQ